MYLYALIHNMVPVSIFGNSFGIVYDPPALFAIEYPFKLGFINCDWFMFCFVWGKQ